MSADNKKADKANADGQQLQVHMAPDLEYSYRDFFSIFVGSEEVIIDFGNRHRAQSDRATIQNHLVMSIQNAFRLHQALGKSLDEARKRIQESADKTKEEAGKKK